MGLSRKKRKMQATIADTLKKGLPLAGLLSSLVMTSSCDLFKTASLPYQTMGDVPMPEPSQITTQEQPEESAIQPPQNLLPDTPAEEKNNVSDVQSLDSPQITTGSPQLPIITDINNESKNKILEKLCPDSINDPKIDPSKLKPVVFDPMIQKHE